MRCNTLLITSAFTFTFWAALSSAHPLSELGPDLSTGVSSAPASTATRTASVIVGEGPDHEHDPNCEHRDNATHITTGHDALNMTSGTKGSADPSPYPGFNASAYSQPHAVGAGNHTGDSGTLPDHGNGTSTDATYDKTIHPRMINESASSWNNHMECYCEHPEHHRYNGTRTPHVQEFNGTRNNESDYDCRHPEHRNGSEHSDKKTTLVPRADVTVCLGPDCKDTTLVTADLSSAGQLEGVHAKDRKQRAKRQVTEIEYEDVAREMSGASIAGGI